MGVEPMNTGFADQRVSHFATDARSRLATKPCDGSISAKTRPTSAALRSAGMASPSCSREKFYLHLRWKPHQ